MPLENILANICSDANVLVKNPKSNDIQIRTKNAT